MGILHRRKTTLAGIDLASLSGDEQRELVRDILEARIHGLCFSPYGDGQGPGTLVSAEQIRERLTVVQPFTRWIRSFSCSNGHEHIPALAHEAGLQTMVGVWLDDDHEQNEIELANAIEIAAAGHVDILAVGNEVLLRGDLSTEQVLDFMHRARRAAPGVPVAYVDAYFIFEAHPEIAAACDVILANCYPFWEGCPAEHAILYMKEMYRRAQRAANGRPVIISETGWPNIGTPERGAIPSPQNAIKYFIDTCRWALQDDVEIFWFSAFDEAWKIDSEGDVGAYWGLWDRNTQPKFF